MQIIDNINITVKENLQSCMHQGSKLSVAAACFSIYAYQELKKQLDSIDELRFIFTSPTFVTEKASKAYVNNLYIFFYVSSGKGYSKIDDYYGHTLWNYIDPFNRETLFIKLDLYSFETTRDFYALPYSDEEFQRVLKNIGKCQEKSVIDSKTTKSERVE